MKRRTFSLLLICLLAAAAFSLNPSDSIRQVMQHLHGAELLQAHSNLCRLAAAENDAAYELRCVRDFLVEAVKQQNKEAEGLARVTLMYCFYNYDMPDSMLLELPHTLAALKKNQTWDYYYNAWNVLIEEYTYEGKLQTALAEARKMYDDAQSTRVNYGLGSAAFALGTIYHAMGRFIEADKFLEESVQALVKEEDITLLLSAYNAWGEALDGLGHYNKLKTVARSWKNVLDDYKKKAEEKGYTPSLNGRYLYCTLATAVAALETGQFAQAEQCLQLADKYAEGRKAIARFKLLQVKARYFAAVRQYDQAIICNNENMQILTAAGDSVSLLTVQMQQANLYTEAGRYREAAELYQTVILRKDRLRNTELANQLDELHTLYQVDKLKLYNDMISGRFYFSLAIGILLLVALILYMVYTHRLNMKNRALYESIQQLQKAQLDTADFDSQSSENEFDRSGRIYHSLCELMKKEELYRDAGLNRDQLAHRLATNAAYVAEAIHKCAGGLTVGEFINQFRLRRAAELLTQDPDLNINQVEDLAGFNSRSTFNRCFRAYFGMSPTEYKAVSKAKKEESIR